MSWMEIDTAIVTRIRPLFPRVNNAKAAVEMALDEYLKINEAVLAKSRSEFMDDPAEKAEGRVK